MRTTDMRGDDVIDSRDVIARFEELQSDLDYMMNDVEDEDDGEAAAQAEEEWGDKAEYDALKALINQAENYGDWAYGATLILHSHFKDYAMQFAEDIGAIDAKASWPNTCIDWDQAARELRMDYTAFDFDGETYWMRA